jgi:hypothetical protein
MLKTIWFEVIRRNWRKHSGKKTGLEEIEKKSTLRAFASRAKNVTWLMKAMMKTGKNGKQLSKAQSSL